MKKPHHPGARWAVTVALLMAAVLLSWSLISAAPEQPRILIVGAWLVFAVVLVLSTVRAGPIAQLISPRALRVTGGIGVAACALMACLSAFVFRQSFDVTGACIILAISFLPLLLRSARPGSVSREGNS